MYTHFDKLDFNTGINYFIVAAAAVDVYDDDDDDDDDDVESISAVH